jgi:hypothetical protein
MFARSIGDDNPAYVDTGDNEVIAPPTFVQSSAQFDPDYPLRPKTGERWFGSGRTPSGTRPDPADDDGDGDSKGGGGSAGGLHAEQHFTYHRQLRPGDVLSATTSAGKTWEKESRRAGKLTFSESITEYRDQDGELVITARGVGVRTEKVIEQN